MKVLAAVVTHNRRDLLSRCLDHLEMQSDPPDKIVVINNGSTDGTAEMLAKRSTPCITQENVGSAGGWDRAIRQAVNEHFDAVWLMDDDGYPDLDALSVLKKALTSRISCVSSIVLREDKPTDFVFPFPILSKDLQPVVLRWHRKLATRTELEEKSTNGRYRFAHLFNGALIRVASAIRAGGINTDFFIYGEEVDFFFRLRGEGDVISALDARHYHPDVSNRPYNSMKVYYYVKNALILNRLHFTNPRLRDVLMVGLILRRMYLRNGLGFVASMLFGKQSPVFYRAVYRGLKGQIGKDFDD